MIPAYLYVTPYYKNPIQHREDKAQLKEDAFFAFDNALTKPDEVAALLRAWAGQCGLPANAEGRLALVEYGHLFLEAYLRLESDAWTRGLFRSWVRYVYGPCAKIEAGFMNNRGSWGHLGLALSDWVLGRIFDTERLDDHMVYSWDEKGTMIREVARTNSGLWYSYFSLAPMLRACQVVNHPKIENLLKPLSWLWSYCLLSPSVLERTWPYKLPNGLFGNAWRWLYPCADKLELPSQNDWPANLFAAAGEQFNVRRWVGYAQLPINGGVSIFRDYCRMEGV